MKKLPALIIALATPTVAACGEGDTGEADAPAVVGATSESVAPAAADLEGTGEVYTGSGDITEVDGERVTISHGPIEGIGWPAMTMGFAAGSPEMIGGLNVGDPVEFAFREINGDYVLTSIEESQ